MKEMIWQNGILLFPLLLLSVIGGTVIIERGLFFWKIRPRSREGMTTALGLFGKSTAKDVLSHFSDKEGSPAYQLLYTALSTRTRTVPRLFQQRLENFRDRQLDKMERRLPILSGIANLATLMGLFGTVAGMISAFSRMSATGSSDPTELAGGISQALVTTAAGLAVAIPVMLAQHLFEALEERHADQMEEVLTECLTKGGVSYARPRENQAASR
ncbi:MAG: MotA/TolQ/ExbB proton channel family protein [Spirochaetales bacterium]|nr:MotA/TolQ/ExbB proton channel family protein [Spirochaetales bacterium]